MAAEFQNKVMEDSLQTWGPVHLSCHFAQLFLFPKTPDCVRGSLTCAFWFWSQVETCEKLKRRSTSSGIRSLELKTCGKSFVALYTN